MNFADLQELNDTFAKVKTRFDEQSRDGLVCRHGFYKNCCVLKLQKASWTNDSMEEIHNLSGIFFSVWSDGKSLSKGRVMYNIHALKLRQLNGYTITSRDFAEDFRRNFTSSRGEWPNAHMDYGPATLMQGWIKSEPAALYSNIRDLMQRFVELSPLIDHLLDSRRR
jgi:hypothetical protein